ncbi:MAG: DUF1080 domain-containing protein [Ferruginibacter sp.]
MKNKFLALAVLLFALMAFKNGDKKATETKNITADNAGWVTLFDGKTTKGWHSYGKASSTGRWKVINGALTIDTTKKGEGGDLCTAEEYDNFDLKLEWKIAPKGNSGIIFYVHEDAVKYPESYETGMEMQVLDNDGHPDGKFPKHRAGDLYDLISCSKETVKPVGEWNTAEIKSKDGKLSLYLNGTNVVNTNLWDDNWRSMVAGSKFKSMTGFGTFKKGRIALQDHGNVVSYRNIKIKQL